MTAYLMTHSLLSSWLYAMKDSGADRDPMQDFLKVLHREPTEQTPAMLDGIKFEDLVTDIVNDDFMDYDSPWFEAAVNVAARVVGGVLQCVVTKTVTISNNKFLLYGRLDALKGGAVFDIKFSRSYERGKYVDSTQHPMYLALVPEANTFTYIVSNGTEVWTETYRRDETPDIESTIEQFMAWLDVNGLTDVYKEKWKARKSE